MEDKETKMAVMDNAKDERLLLTGRGEPNKGAAAPIASDALFSDSADSARLKGHCFTPIHRAQKHPREISSEQVRAYDRKASTRELIHLAANPAAKTVPVRNPSLSAGTSTTRKAHPGCLRT